MEEVEHGSAVLAAIEGHTHLTKGVSLVRLFEGGQCVLNLGAE